MPWCCPFLSPGGKISHHGETKVTWNAVRLYSDLWRKRVEILRMTRTFGSGLEALEDSSFDILSAGKCTAGFPVTPGVVSISLQIRPRFKRLHTYMSLNLYTCNGASAGPVVVARAPQQSGRGGGIYRAATRDARLQVHMSSISWSSSMISSAQQTCAMPASTLASARTSACELVQHVLPRLPAAPCCLSAPRLPACEGGDAAW
jgi:hypothetical protein